GAQVDRRLTDGGRSSYDLEPWRQWQHTNSSHLHVRSRYTSRCEPNTHQGLKLVNGATYKALDVILDKVYLGHRISADAILHRLSGWILLAAETTRDFHFVAIT